MESVKSITDRYHFQAPYIQRSLAMYIEESNKDIHDNCDLNNCKACVGE